MMNPVSSLIGSVVESRQGPVGVVTDVHFSDQTWSLRSLVCRLTKGGPRILVPAEQVFPLSKDRRAFHFDLDREQLLHFPPLSSDLPVSQQQFCPSDALIAWPAIGLMGGQPFILASVPSKLVGGDPSLRSFRAVRRYCLHSPQGVIGHITDFMVDHEGVIRNLTVRLRPWFRPKMTIVPTTWIDSIDWAAGSFETTRTPAES